MSMRPTFMGFEASKSALFASQKGLDIVGHNLANMSTEGYTRQRVDQVSVDTYAFKNRKADSSKNHLGMGTDVNGVQQVRDERMDTAFRNSYSDTSYYGRSNDMLSEIESILSEIDPGVDGYGYGLSYGIKEMYNALQVLSGNVNLEANSVIFADSVKNVCSILNRTATTLSEAREAYKQDFKTEVDDVNSIMEDISSLNKKITDIISGAGYTEQYGPNELLDKRNMLLDELSAFGKVDVVHQNDGSVNVSLNGHECIKGERYDTVILQENGDNGIAVRWKSNSEDATSGNGILKAASEIINGRGVNASSDSDTTVRGFNYYMDKLDTFAEKLADVLNSTLPVKTDAMGNPVSFDDNEGKYISYKKLVGATVNDDGFAYVNTDRKVTAANIAVSDDLARDATYILTDKKSSDNQYFLNLIGKLTDEELDFTNGNEPFKGTFQDFITDFSSKIGGDVRFAQSKVEACEQYSDELQNNRESITGVSKSEETVSMLTYNRAFQAAAKMMTTMDELLDIIINQVGALG